jgi:hypothetical protein
MGLPARPAVHLAVERTDVPYRFPALAPDTARRNHAEGYHQHSTSRRALLAGAAATPALALPAVAMVATTPDPHLAWWAEREALRVELNRPDRDDIGDEDPIFDQMVRMEELLAETPARTLAGVRAQIAFLAHECRGSGPAIVTEGLENALATLERLAGRA